MNTHTPGTWSVKLAKTYAAQVVAEVPRPRGTREVTICRVATPDSHADYDVRRDQAQANARLIAAAPGLLREAQVLRCLATSPRYQGMTVAAALAELAANGCGHDGGAALALVS